MAINFNLAGPGFNALQTLQVAGQAADQQYRQRQMQMEQDRLRQQQQTRAQAAEQLQAGDFGAATATALGGGDFDMAKQISGLAEDQRKQIAGEAEVIGQVAFGLRDVPMEQRQARLQMLAPQLAARGISADELAAVDLSDSGIAGYISLSQSIKDALAANYTNARISDVATDNQRADRLADNTVQNTAARLALARNADARGAASNARAAEARREGRVRFGERDKDRAALAAGGRFIPTSIDDLDY